MNNFDDISKKYRDEIVNLYKNQNIDASEYIPSDDTPDESMNSENQSSDTVPQNTEEEMYMPPAVMENSDVYNENMSQNMGTGFLRVEVTSANNALPVSDVLVIITKYIDDSEKIVRILQTDADGRTDLIELSAPLQNGTELSSAIPYSNYNAIIYQDGYYEVHNKNIPVFSGITSLQPVNLIPMPAHKNGSDVLTFYQQEPEF